MMACVCEVVENRRKKNTLHGNTEFISVTVLNALSGEFDVTQCRIRRTRIFETLVRR